ncbi:uncharacterized protein PITG_07758 [Phytophthora infestans T30-4]|uniref:Uncharacterized protein n=1 Tax=Phytophthora infestans (strain T30-4) TaxID=403677 RepID=D0N916_PHYIT|nr:uncharacterized protein PITG_07758 [Phytophthora infestans T30-4]EEY54051.1 conserved hypothetical protein [Phytophthora infestans T30-4]|eukprot:XP_002904682.1 conserved hypothetical protein [Phytophthora infestans T30-4]
MGCAYGSVLASLGRTGELCESVLVSLGRTVVRERLGVLRTRIALCCGVVFCTSIDEECENKCNTLTISTKCHTSTVSSSAKPVFPSALLCDHLYRYDEVDLDEMLLAAKLRDSSFSIDAETLVGNALVDIQIDYYSVFN